MDHHVLRQGHPVAIDDLPARRRNGQIENPRSLHGSPNRPENPAPPVSVAPLPVGESGSNPPNKSFNAELELAGPGGGAGTPEAGIAAPKRSGSCGSRRIYGRCRRIRRRHRRFRHWFLAPALAASVAPPERATFSARHPVHFLPEPARQVSGKSKTRFHSAHTRSPHRRRPPSGPAGYRENFGAAGCSRSRPLRRETLWLAKHDPGLCALRFLWESMSSTRIRRKKIARHSPTWYRRVTTGPLDLFLDFARQTAWEAGRAHPRHLPNLPRHRNKGQTTPPVTIADRAAGGIHPAPHRIHVPGPRHSRRRFGGSAASASGAPHRWIIDPIDGTKSFICGVPIYAVLSALEIEGEATVGIAHFPALDEMVSAATGPRLLSGMAGACRVSQKAPLSKAILAHADTSAFARQGKGEAWDRLRQATLRQRRLCDAYG